MTPHGSVPISAAVEGILDEAVVRRLMDHVGVCPRTVYGKTGKQFLKAKIAAYNNAARHAPWVVLVDLDTEADCAPSIVATWLPRPARQMCFRVAVRTLEAWLLADAERLAAFLAVDRDRLPAAPERLEHPKRTLVSLARRSRRQAIRQDFVPRPGSGRTEGPAYTSRLIEYVTDSWRPEIAAARADSLRRAIECLRRLGGGNS